MRARRIIFPSVIAAFVLSLHTGAAPAQEKAGGSYTKIPTVKGIHSIEVGKPAPDFTVRDLAGKEFRLKDCCGKDAVLLFFWSFFCGPCREEIPMINRISSEYGGKGLQVIGVNLDGAEMKKPIDKFVANEKIGFRIVFDELIGDAFLVADPYGVAGTPALFIIDKNGVVSYTGLGVLSAAKMREEIEKAVK